MSEPHFNGPLARLLREAFADKHPDPWPVEMDIAVRDYTAVPLCLNCLFPQGRHSWFCPQCAYPTGDFVTSMPYLPVFVDGELFRRGVMGPPEKRVGVLLFYFFYAGASFNFFAPLYWFWMIRRWHGKPICYEHRRGIQFEEDLSPSSGPE